MSGKKSGGRRKERGNWGLYRKSFPRSVAWAVDADYTDQLSPEEKAWLARFNDHYYGADFRTDYDGEWSKPERRERYIAKNTANVDLYAAVAGGDALDNLEDTDEVAGPDFDTELSPEYLNSPEYKRRREEFRSHLTPRRKPVAPVKTPEYEGARKRLTSYVNGKNQK